MLGARRHGVDGVVVVEVILLVHGSGDFLQVVRSAPCKPTSRLKLEVRTGVYELRLIVCTGYLYICRDIFAKPHQAYLPLPKWCHIMLKAGSISLGFMFN